MHSGYFWIDPDIRRPCFLGPCFKLFRIINELNRIRACRLPHCPRSRRGRKLLSLQNLPRRATLPYLVRATKSKGNDEGEEREGRKREHQPIRARTDLFCHVGIKCQVATRPVANKIEQSLPLSWTRLARLARRVS